MPSVRLPALAVLVLALSLMASARAASGNHVLLVTLDGVGAYNLADTNASLPTLRRLLREGASAEGVRISNPAVTWPNHTTLVSGVHPDRHSVLFNGILRRQGPGRPVVIEPEHDRSELVAVPTLVDRVHEAGLRTAEINWPCTRGSRSFDLSFPDVPQPVRNMSPSLRDELVAAGILESPDDAAFQGHSAAFRDRVWTESAVHVVRRHRPNLMLLHFLVCDSVQHRYGPQSPAAHAAMALVDSQLAAVLKAVEDAGMRRRTTVVVTADHGFETALKLVQPNVAFRKAGLVTVGTAPGLVRADVQSISEGGTALVYVTDPARRAELLPKVRALLERMEGVAEVMGRDRFAALHYPDPERNPQMADLVVVGKPGFAFGNEARGDDEWTEVTLANGNQGHHGFLSGHPRMAPFLVLWGRGIRSGARTGFVDNVDIAPTMARLLRTPLPGAEGRVLAELLSEGGR